MSQEEIAEAYIVCFLIIMIEMFAAPKLSNYTTALGTYNIKSFTYEINQHMHARAHARTYTQ